MKRICLNGDDWTLTGLWPNTFRMEKSCELGEYINPSSPKIPAKVPGAVQLDLIRNGDIEDINTGLNSRNAEWTEHREWVYSKTITVPVSMKGKRIYLEFEGLDYSGSVVFSGNKVGKFRSTHMSYSFDITPFVKYGAEQLLSIVFDLPPRLPGQIGYTYKVYDYKPRFNYGWDWVSRTVSTGIWHNVWLCAYESVKIEECSVNTDLKGDFTTGKVWVNVELDKEPDTDRVLNVKWLLKEKNSSKDIVSQGKKELAGKKVKIDFDVLDVKKWYPNDMGNQPLYDFCLQVVDENGLVYDGFEIQVGFKNVEWVNNPESPEDARPSLLKINGEEVFLRGANWVPLSSYFGGVSSSDYRKTLLQYKKMNVNILRVWGGGILEKEDFYELCDEFGIMVWQEFPLSSSGISDYPPFDRETIFLLSNIARYMVRSRCHHVSHIIWSGGNELAQGHNGEMEGRAVPIDTDHPLIAEFEKVVKEHDPCKKFIPTSGHGPRAFGEEEDFGKGLHHDVHGQWAYLGPEKHYRYYNKDDSLWRSEVGVPGYTSHKLIQAYNGNINPWPADNSNCLWLHHGSWWLNAGLMTNMYGPWDKSDPTQLSQHLTLSRYLQYEGYRAVVEACRRRAFRCSLVTVWMGHDCFWTTANNSVIEVDGSLKPAYSALQRSFAPVKISLKYDKLWVAPEEQGEFEVWLLKDNNLSSSERVNVSLKDIHGNVFNQEEYTIDEEFCHSSALGTFKFVADEYKSRLFFIEVSIVCQDNEYRDVYIFGQDRENVLSGLRRLDSAKLDIMDIDVIEENDGMGACIEVSNVGNVAAVMTEVVPADIGCRYASSGNAVTIFPGGKRKIYVYGITGVESLEVSAVNTKEIVKVSLV